MPHMVPHDMSLALFDDGPFVIVSRYLKRKNGVFWFDRRVPKDVQPHVRCERIRKSLSTRDGREAHRRLGAINAKYEAQWQAVRSSGAAPLGGAVRTASCLVHTVAAEPLETQARLPEASQNVVGHAPPARPVVYFLDALELYLMNHEKGSQPAFLKTIFPARDYLLKTIGNLPLAAITRQHANLVRDAVLQAGCKTASARRRIGTLSAIFTYANREHGLKLDNPFDKLQIAKDS